MSSFMSNYDVQSFAEQMDTKVALLLDNVRIDNGFSIKPQEDLPSTCTFNTSYLRLQDLAQYIDALTRNPFKDSQDDQSSKPKGFIT